MSLLQPRGKLSPRLLLLLSGALNFSCWFNLDDSTIGLEETDVPELRGSDGTTVGDGGGLESTNGDSGGTGQGSELEPDASAAVNATAEAGDSRGSDQGSSTASDSPDAGRREPGCEAGTCAECSAEQTRCLDGQVQTCAEGLWSEETSPCLDAFCVAGACKPCSPESSLPRCDAGRPESCGPDGAWLPGVACSGATPVCTQGQCVACQPDDKRCRGSRVETCNAQGAAWEETQTCTGDAPACLEATGDCGLCEPNDVQCADDTVQRCTEEGSWLDQLNCGGELPQCVGGSCRACDPALSEQRCLGEQSQVCADDGDWGPARDCPPDETCRDDLGSRCGCAEGARRCGPSGSPELCGNGIWVEQTACERPQSACSAGGCVCRDEDCAAPGLSRCDASTGACAPCLGSADCDHVAGRLSVCLNPGSTGECVECVTDQDCADGHACDPLANACVVLCEGDRSVDSAVDFEILVVQGCGVHRGDLSFLGSSWEGPLPENFDSLNDLVRVEGSLDFFSQLDAGLENLTVVTGTLDFNRTSPGAFPSLERVGILEVSDASLENLMVPKLEAIDGSLILQDIDSGSLAELASLRSIGNHIRLVETFGFVDFSGLVNLDSVGGGLEFRDSDIESLDGLSRLSTLEYIAFHDLDELRSINGLQGIEEIAGDVLLDVVPQLASLQGLAGLHRVGGRFLLNNSLITTVAPLLETPPDALTERLTITNNALLPQCEAEQLAAHWDIVCTSCFRNTGTSVCSP